MCIWKFSKKLCIFMKIEINYHWQNLAQGLIFFFWNMQFFLCNLSLSLFLQILSTNFCFFFFMVSVFSPVAARKFFFLLFVQTMCCISRFDSGVFWLSVQVSGDGGCTIVFGNFHSLRLRVLAL